MASAPRTSSSEAGPSDAAPAGPTTALPAEDHLRPPKGAGGAGRAWLLLLPPVVLVALYFVLPEAGQLAIMLGSLPVSVGILGYLIFRTIRVGRDKEKGVKLMEARNLDMAAHTFDELALSSPRPVSQHAEAVFYLGNVALLKGDLDRALSLFSAVAAYPGLGGWATLFERLPGWFALAYALKGDSKAAQAWLDVGEARCDATSRVLLLLPGAVVRLRFHQDAPGAAALLTREWQDAEVDLAIDMLREMGAVRAFALAHLPLKAESEGQIAALLEGAARGPMGALAFLGVQWPEMNAFLIRRRLIPDPNA